MRKFVLLAFAVFSLSVYAQKVTPLNIQLTEVNLDSLRTLYIAEPAMYRASLEVLSQSLSKDAEAVSVARAELKDEQAHAKEMNTSINQALKMTAALRKLYAKEESELKTMQKVVEKQQKKLNSQRNLNQESRTAYQQLLEKQQKELGYSLRELAERQRAIMDLETSLQDHLSSLAAYEQETIQKATELNQIMNQLNQNTAAVKAEQKAAKKLK